MSKLGFAEGLKGIKATTGRATPKRRVEPEMKAVEPKGQQPAGVAPSRQGKVAIAGYFDPAVRKQFAILAVKEDKSQVALLAEALNLLFERYGEAPIADA